MLLLPVITVGCVTNPKNNELKRETIVLPAKPERIEFSDPTDINDLLEVLNYYEFLIEDWEIWSKKVEKEIQLFANVAY